MMPRPPPAASLDVGVCSKGPKKSRRCDQRGERCKRQPPGQLSKPAPSWCERGPGLVRAWVADAGSDGQELEAALRWGGFAGAIQAVIEKGETPRGAGGRRVAGPGCC